MNKIITLIMCVAFFATVSGQTIKVEDRVKALEEELKTLKGQVETQNGLIASMQSRLNELADRNAEYKKQLDFRQILSVTVDSVKYGIASAEGNAKTGNVIVILMALNTGEDAYTKILHGASLNDYDGNIYQCSEDSMSVGGLSNYEVLRKDINTKILLKFTNVSANARISNISFYGGGGTTLFSLRDIKIDWK
jgi:hypothetical protein